MVVLGEIEIGCGRDFGGDRAMARRRQPLLELIAGLQRQRFLCGVADIDAGSVLRADIVALAHALGRVVVLPELAQQFGIADLRRLVDHPDHLVVAGPAGADLLIGCVRGRSGGVANHRHPNTGQVPEPPLDAPEAAHSERGDLGSLGVWPGQGVAIEEMGLGGGDGRLAPRQSGIGGWHGCLLLAENVETEHGTPLNGWNQ